MRTLSDFDRAIQLRDAELDKVQVTLPEVAQYAFEAEIAQLREGGHLTPAMEALIARDAGRDKGPIERLDALFRTLPISLVPDADPTYVREQLHALRSEQIYPERLLRNFCYVREPRVQTALMQALVFLAPQIADLK